MVFRWEELVEIVDGVEKFISEHRLSLSPFFFLDQVETKDW